MNVKNIREVNRLVDQLQSLKSEIESINQMAEFSIKADHKSFFELRSEGINDQTVLEDIIDEDGSLKNPSLKEKFISLVRGVQTKKGIEYEQIKVKVQPLAPEIIVKTLSFSVDEYVILEMLGILLSEKIKQKDKIEKALTEYGITI